MLVGGTALGCCSCCPSVQVLPSALTLPFRNRFTSPSGQIRECTFLLTRVVRVLQPGQHTSISRSSLRTVSFGLKEHAWRQSGHLVSWVQHPWQKICPQQGVSTANEAVSRQIPHVNSSSMRVFDIPEDSLVRLRVFLELTFVLKSPMLQSPQMDMCVSC